MKLETLAEVNVERAARRPVIVVTDTANGEQRLVKAKDIAADPLRAARNYFSMFMRRPQSS